ncbi:hypothetical protein SRB5_46750 [Streptomyces sp. RB5]|uniref:HTH gntR-type domain-containing protein n=1 Tax=Streptomyces smaragdinus TaxID=2585196 RepID=A0A7K0CLZ8_9ACTN|nr:FCD domain-containing protein [Streptomyces smaragdinus]MQY14507.1 hypothetical protein [Streptomyces smaragdinus]
MTRQLAGELRTGSRAESVARAIERRIAEQGLVAGDLIGTKAKMREEYGVAVATMNEAVRLLSDRSVIYVRPGVKGGLFVASRPVLVRLGRKMLELSGDSVSVADCLMMRNALEPLVMEETARHVTADGLAELREIVWRMERPGVEAEEYMRLNWELHLKMADATPNQVLRHTYQSVLEYVGSRVQRVATEQAAVDVIRGARIHRALVEAIADGDPDEVRRAIAAHSALTSPPGAGD